MTSGGIRVLLKGYSHDVAPGTSSPGKADGSIEFTDRLSRISVGRSEVVLSPLPFTVIGCTNNGDAVGGGGGTVKADDHAVSSGNLTLRDGDKGTCQGTLISPTLGALQCRCKVTVKTNTSSGGAATAASSTVAALDAGAALSGRGTARQVGLERQAERRTLTVLNGDGTAAADVSAHFRGLDGARASLTANGSGVISLEKLGFVPRFATLSENPARWTPYPARVNTLNSQEFSLDTFLLDFYGRARMEFAHGDLARPLPRRTVGSVLADQVAALANWIGGSLMGEFNENPSSSQIVLDMVVTMIPVVDQIGDARDIVAVVLRMRDQSERKRFLNWLSLATCLIGLIPELGSALRAAARLVMRDFLRAGGNAARITGNTADAVFAAIRKLGLGDPKRFLTSINWDRVASEVVAAYRELGRRAATVINYLQSIAEAPLRAFLEQLRTLFELSGADRQLRAAIRWLKEKMPAWLQKSLDRRPKSIFPDASYANQVVLDGSSSMVTRLENGLDKDLYSLKRTMTPVARYLTPAGWRAETHKIFERRFGKPLEFKLSNAPGETFKVWNAPSGHLFGTYDELNRLRAASREQLHSSRRARISEAAAASNATNDVAIREIYSKLRKYEHHHLIEMQDMKLVGAFDENIVFGVREEASKLLSDKYNQLPCIVVPKDYHTTITSELKRSRKEIGGITVDDIIEEYSLAYEYIMSNKVADEMGSILADVVETIKAQYFR
ncbi:hypothetical protein [Methylorubrum rhodinum]|nr:hypothetical protein [Methylorubrum rhodinum]